MQVTKEEKSTQRRQFWVKMINMEEGVDDQDFRDSLQKLIGMPVREIQRIPHGYLIECGSDEARNRVMNFNGVELNHRVVRVTYGEKSMTGNQIFDFVAQALQLSEDVRGVPQPRKEKETRPDTRHPSWRPQVRYIESSPEEEWDEWGEWEEYPEWVEPQFSCKGVTAHSKGDGKGRLRGKARGRAKGARERRVVGDGTLQVLRIHPRRSHMRRWPGGRRRRRKPRPLL